MFLAVELTINSRATDYLRQQGRGCLHRLSIR